MIARTRAEKKTTSLYSAILLLALLLSPAGRPERFQPVALPNSEIRLIPESQRSFERVILGLEAFPPDERLFPEGSSRRERDAKFVFLRDELYWLQFELLHGRIMAAAPAHSRFFVAIPRPRTPGPGGEESSFRRYLRNRLNWSDAEIRRRVRFFQADEVLRYPRDMAEPIGRDVRDRLVLAIGSDADNFYAEPLARLVDAFPNDFRREVLEGVNTEGGDISGVLLPNEGIGVIVGYHRIRRWVEKKYGAAVAARPLKQSVVEEAKQAFKRAFFGLEVIVVGEEELAGSSPESRELFHADMVLTVVRGTSGIVAFVPSYAQAPVDSTTFAGLSDDIRRRAQGVYDRAARLLVRRGYRVVRMPFRDHPDRTPVQAGAYADPDTGAQVVLLGKYPYHFRLPDGSNPQEMLQAGVSAMEAALAGWRRNPSPAAWKRLSGELERLRALMDRMPSLPNPDFDAQARLYEAEGIRVVAVPIYPTGEGGIHCLLLN